MEQGQRATPSRTTSAKTAFLIGPALPRRYPVPTAVGEFRGDRGRPHPAPPSVQSLAQLAASGTLASLVATIGGVRRRKSRNQVRPVRVKLHSSEVSEAPAAVKEEASATAAAPANPKKPAYKQRVLSGVQPTGDLHLGNYFGAIKQWVGMQEEYDCFFCIVDLHAITVPHSPKELRKATMSTAAAYLASGIDPEKSAVFVQSAVPQHSQLAWLLNTQTPMSWLQQMTQYKVKARKQGEAVGLGLFAYPVLMAADILLYQANKVPVGEDQMEHLYLARDVAERMNKIYKKTAPKKRTLFRMPEALVGKAGARVMGLTDGTNKMSKSDPNTDSRINLIDEPSAVKRKIKRCKTDSIIGMELANPERPEARNLLNLYSLVTGTTPEAAEAACKDDNWGTFKGKLTEAVIEYLTPIQGEYHRLLEDRAHLEATLNKGRGKAIEVAAETLARVEAAMGFGY